MQRIVFVSRGYIIINSIVARFCYRLTYNYDSKQACSPPPKKSEMEIWKVMKRCESEVKIDSEVKWVGFKVPVKAEQINDKLN